MLKTRTTNCYKYNIALVKVYLTQRHQSINYPFAAAEVVAYGIASQRF